jgi:predicted PurR-regulated permease PerM
MSKLAASIGIVFALWIGRPALLPIISAAFLWYLANTVASYCNKVIHSRAASGILAGAGLLGIIVFFIVLIKPMFADLYEKMPEISAGISRMLAEISELAGTELSFFDQPNLHGVITKISASVMSAGTAFGMVLIYMIFIFLEQRTFPKKLRALLPSKGQFSKMSFILHSIDAHMKKYIAIKTWISFLSGLASYLLFLVLGIDFAGVWGFIVFILNYIPTIGSIVAGALPCIYVFAMTGDPKVPLLAAIGSAAVNFAFGNIMEPKMMGKTLNLSTMAILMNLVFWGMIWGPAGMFFSVPILAMAFIVCAQFDKTRYIAVILSADGEIPDKIER